ncbi:uncharacterized protein CELE_Y50D4C.12 [Caenorhabditis elegans]|uniref:Uncharacterized protein n=1 Tax=Caenorhabditis elegans TaxID=6239 RepID=A0A2K5ATX5_CAEEL|nr:Uncharacterized protein CELE_Y50D4C.12 [Caenorhabditis elegans]SPC47967.1 Uncharacterized protein CELE_Y50D4C.12 [Caenorhabditis elegans]|eukprot:NP_001348778.1 Uncharacterized protein CELE_Y50D4C.12 [Caenorhabditis elegans]
MRETLTDCCCCCC